MQRNVLALSDFYSNRGYAYGNVVAETLPVALIIARESQGFGEALGLAALLPKQADTMPALVGALVGASLGAAAVPPSWRLAAPHVPTTFVSPGDPLPAHDGRAIVLRVGLAGLAREIDVGQRREVATRVERRLQRDLFGRALELPDTQTRGGGDADDRR